MPVLLYREGSAWLCAFIIGPHGMSEIVNLMRALWSWQIALVSQPSFLISESSSIATPSASRTRRVHLIWQIETLSEYHDVMLPQADM